MKKKTITKTKTKNNSSEYLITGIICALVVIYFIVCILFGSVMFK